MTTLRGKKVLITGATGFIGSNLAQRLVKEGANVHATVRSTSNLWRTNEITPYLTLHEVSLSDKPALETLIQNTKPEYIFHTAAYGTASSQNDDQQIIETNYLGTVNLLNACNKIKYKGFINTGSSSEYGMKKEPMCEDDVLAPITNYGVSKAAATQFCLKEALFNKLPVYTIRPFSVYGDYETATRLIPTILVNALLDKEITLSAPHFVRDYIYIDDIIEMYLTVAEKLPENYYIFNAGTGVQSTIQDVIETLQSIQHKPLKISWGVHQTQPWEPTNWIASIKKAEKIFGWKPKYSLHQGLKKSLEWFKQNIHLYIPGKSS